MAAQIDDDVVDLLIGKIGQAFGPLERTHARIGTALLDGFADEAVGGLVQEAGQADRRADAFGLIAVAARPMAGRADVYVPGLAEARVATGLGLGVDLLGPIREHGVGAQIGDDGLNARPAKMVEGRHSGILTPVADGGFEKRVRGDAQELRIGERRRHARLADRVFLMADRAVLIEQRLALRQR